MITQNTGQSAEEIERYIAIPIEMQFAGILNATVVRTSFLFGLSLRPRHLSRRACHAVCRYGRPVPGARRRLMEPHRRRSDAAEHRPREIPVVTGGTARHGLVRCLSSSELGKRPTSAGASPISRLAVGRISLRLQCGADCIRRGLGEESTRRGRAVA